MILGSAELTAAIFLLLFFVLILAFLVYGRVRRGGRNLREIPAFSRLIYAIGLAVEDGRRLHVSLGRGDMTGEQSAAGLAGLSILERVARTASVSDRPPVATSGDGTLSILSQSAMAGAYAGMESGERVSPEQARLTGLTPFAYAAGTIPLIQDEGVSANILAGHFGPEIALITEAADRAGGFTLAGTDQIPGQAVLYAAAQEPLIGEELYAGGAYLRAGHVHIASLRAQDVVRWLLIAAMLVGGVLKLFG